MREENGKTMTRIKTHIRVWTDQYDDFLIYVTVLHSPNMEFLDVRQDDHEKR